MTDRPVLDRWLDGASPAHPLLQADKPDFFLDTFEAIVAPINAANPTRLPTKVKALRTLTTDGELLEQRAELLIGSMLARGGVGFEFAQDHPDYVLDGGALGIEVGSRALDGPWALHDRLEEHLAASGRKVRVNLAFDDRPLKLGAARIEEIAETILQTDIGSTMVTIRFEDVGLSAGLHPDPIDLVSKVTVTFAGGLGLPLASHMSDVEREVGNKVAEKTRQAAKVPTILLLDMSRVGWGWMRGPHEWIPALRRILSPSPFVGLGVFFSTLDQAEPLGVHLAVAEALDPALEFVIDTVAAALGLTAFDGVGQSEQGA